MDNKPVQRLHDRATRGEALTEAERTTLDAWYGQQDVEEAAQFAASAPVSPDLDKLRAEVSEALTQLHEVTRRIQSQSNANEALRQEVADLSGRLTRGAPLKAV